jgi:hypothetical protein
MLSRCDEILRSRGSLQNDGLQGGWGSARIKPQPLIFGLRGFLRDDLVGSWDAGGCFCEWYEGWYGRAGMAGLVWQGWYGGAHAKWH